MVSLNHQRHRLFHNGMSRSHSADMLTPSKKVSSMATMSASDIDLAKQLFKANVKAAIDDRVSGTGARYQELVAKFASQDSSTAQLCQYLTALTHFVTRLEPPMYSSLVREILSMSWVMHPSMVQVYIEFICALATAHTTYLPLMLSYLLAEFTDVSLVPNGKRTEFHFHAHWAIQHLLEVVPSGHAILVRSIREKFPHKSVERREQISYIFNLIRIGEYAPHVKGDILSLCVERVVQIDVEIQLELDRLEDDLEEELLLSQFDGKQYSAEDDINTEPPAVDDGSASTSSLLDPNTSLATLRDTIATLDALMATIFHYVEPVFPSTSTPTAEAEHIFDSLLNTFLSVILPTYHSRHAQFLIFRTSQSNALFLDKFLGLLIERSLDPSLSNIARQASSAYLASFIARAKYVTPDTVRTVVEMLCVFLSRVLDDMPGGKFIPGGVAGNHGLHGVYAVFQAVIYIYCFRWRELSVDDEESGQIVWMPQLNVIQRMAWSWINPLAHVSYDVAQEFAHRSYQLQHIFVHSILKENARKGLIAGFLNRDAKQMETSRVETEAEMIELQSAAEAKVLLDQKENDVPKDWYPFDPYSLPRSKGYVTDSFLEYMPSDSEEDEMETDEESSDSDEMDEDEE